MKGRWTAVALLFCTTLVVAAPPWPKPPHEVQAPLLYVQVKGPEGLNVAFVESNGGQAFAAPVQVGLRPAYRYRMKLTGIKDRPGVAAYASVDVCGTLRLPSTLSAATFPTPIVFDDEDFEKAINGTMVTKILLVEDADKTQRLAPFEGQPVQVDVSRDEDPINAAAKYGRPVLIVRLGMREPDRAELARLGTNNILYPGMTALPPSTTPSFRKPAIDPRFRGPWDVPEEILRDGGDNGRPAHLIPNGNVDGLDPSDAVAEYVTSRGRRRLTKSNEVCVVVPRFIALRQLTPSVIYEEARSLASILKIVEENELRRRASSRPAVTVEEAPTLKEERRVEMTRVATPPLQVMEVATLRAYELDQGPASLLWTTGLRTLRDVDRARLAKQVELAIRFSKVIGPQKLNHEMTARVVGQMENVGQLVGSMETREVVYLCIAEHPEPPEQPLCLLKWCSTTHAQVGDVITFFLRYTNHGGKPIKDIAVSDSLTGRLEYVAGTAKSDREAVFVTQENEAGSLILRWEVRDPLPPGKHGVVSFQARVK